MLARSLNNQMACASAHVAMPVELSGMRPIGDLLPEVRQRVFLPDAKLTVELFSRFDESSPI